MTTPSELRHVRAALDAIIERALELRDQLDGDPDLEDNDPLEETDALEEVGDDEPDLGWPATGNQTKLGTATDDGDNTAPERAGAGFVQCRADDLEPTMGATGTQHGSDHLWGWSRSTRDDECEDGHDAEHVDEDGGDIQDEPHDGDTDREPTLGWPERDNQIGFCGVTHQDGELEPSLGAPESVPSGSGLVVADGRVFDLGTSQENWARGDMHDREVGDDNGIADTGGVVEQQDGVIYATADDFERPNLASCSYASLMDLKLRKGGQP